MKSKVVSVLQKQDGQGLDALQNILDGLPFGVAVFNRQLTLEKWNNKLIKLLDMDSSYLEKQLKLNDILYIKWEEQKDRHGNEFASKIISELTKAETTDELFPFNYEYRVDEERNLEIKGEVVPEEGLVLTIADISLRSIPNYYMQSTPLPDNEHITDLETQSMIEARGAWEIMEQEAAKAVQMAEDLAITREIAENSAKHIEAILNAMSDVLVTMDTKGNIMTCNHSAKNMFGYSREEVIGKNLLFLINTTQMISDTDVEQFIKALDENDLRKNHVGTGYKKCGSTFPIELSIREVKVSGEKQYTIVISDVTERHEAEMLIREMALHDSLTGLANRNLLQQRLDEAMRMAIRMDKKVAVMFLDLDGFKPVNDMYGHAMGDKLLRVVANRLQGSAREVDTVARLGGDEFTVIMPNVADKTVIEAVAQKILEVVAEPYQIKHEALYISASIGITLYPADAKSSDVLLQNADQAMYAAKAKGRNRYHYFTPDMQKNALHRVQLLNDMRNAVSNNEFELYYQPIVNLQTGKITKAEALIRWNHPTRGLVSPLDFIPLAEETGHIIEIGDWVFKTATNQLVSWQSMLDTKINISINTSPEQYIHSKQTTAKWFDYVESLGLDCNSLIMELTESTLMESGADVTDRLHAFRERGAKVALDDFGTGYSSLSYLHQFDIDFIKIDKSFVRNLKADSNDLILCEAMIIMAHKLGIKVIAEGVETDQQLALLDKAGCDYAQGYLFSKPVPVEAFEDLVSNWYLKAGGLDHLL